MLKIPGSRALSDFRRDKLLERLRGTLPGLESVDARFVHYVDVARELDPGERTLLERLLGREAEAAPPPADGLAVWVIPRLGTVSPWSSKATDIARICGLAAVSRIERGLEYRLAPSPAAAGLEPVLGLLHDRMTQSARLSEPLADELFAHDPPRPLDTVPLMAEGAAALERANAEMGLALSDEEIEYLLGSFRALGRDPTDVELMMFAQANSEHCRHKIFNADWVIDGETQPKSLFAMIRNTHAHAPDGVLSAYRDNAAVIEGHEARRFFADPATGAYDYVLEPVHVLMKVETHNHPTAISPFAGAATGSGGEIRDEGATGRGARPKAGLTGFSVSHLRIPDWPRPWETPFGKPDRIASALDIMLEGPIGAAAFNNEFGRPNLAGYFRAFEQPTDRPGLLRGYHKPIMIAGGLGNIRAGHVEKSEVPVGAKLIVLGGPAMLIGLGGGAASSQGSGQGTEALDYASVQRDNPEMQRRCQEVIDACWALGDDNPIVLIHDVGAGGLSNAVPEAVDHSSRGARIGLRDVPTAEPGLSPMELWCNEAQERYVLVVRADDLERFESFCRRERCPYAVIGTITGDRRLVVEDPLSPAPPVDMPMEVLFGKPPKMRRDASRRASALDTTWSPDAADLEAALHRVLSHPTVADKSFLIHIGDRTVGGLTARDQLVGPWQVPVADVAVTASGFEDVCGEAMAMGERTPVALASGPASGRLAVAEAVTNLLAADIATLRDVRLSANWMAAAGVEGEDAVLFDTVRAVGEELCPALGIAIPVGKDSLSMRTVWQEAGEERAVVAPVSLIVSAFAPVADVRRTLTPELRLDRGDTVLIAIDLGVGRWRLGGSVLGQVYGTAGGEPADLDDPTALVALADALRSLRDRDLVLAYHDRSDGGLIATVCEMAFASRAGVELEIPQGAPPVAWLFSEEVGVVLQVPRVRSGHVMEVLTEHGLGDMSAVIGRVGRGERLVVRAGGETLLDVERRAVHASWSETTFRMQALRDNPACAAEAREAALDPGDPGLSPQVGFELADAPRIATGARPRVAILREQGVNGQIEMAAAFDRAGFKSVDVHMSQILAGEVGLAQFRGLVACGGFSYGDVLGAGEGWAKSILFNERAREAFEAFFARRDTFALGVCNGCQMFSALKSLIPGAAHWPRFLRNRSEQFEARLSLVEIADSPSVLLAGMAGSRLLISTAHGEGRAAWASDADAAAGRALEAVRYVDNHGRPATRYPENPNGSPDGLCGLTSEDGRVTIMMPHPERVFRTLQHSWHPEGWGEDGPWMQLWRNARDWVG